MNQPEMCKFLIEEGLDVDHVSFSSRSLPNSKSVYVLLLHLLEHKLTRIQELLAKFHGWDGCTSIQEGPQVYKRMS